MPIGPCTALFKVPLFGMITLLVISKMKRRFHVDRQRIFPPHNFILCYQQQCLAQRRHLIDIYCECRR